MEKEDLLTQKDDLPVKALVDFIERHGRTREDVFWWDIGEDRGIGPYASYRLFSIIFTDGAGFSGILGRNIATPGMGDMVALYRLPDRWTVEGAHSTFTLIVRDDTNGTER